MSFEQRSEPGIRVLLNLPEVPRIPADETREPDQDDPAHLGRVGFEPVELSADLRERPTESDQFPWLMISRHKQQFCTFEPSKDGRALIHIELLRRIVGGIEKVPHCGDCVRFENGGDLFQFPIENCPLSLRMQTFIAADGGFGEDKPGWLWAVLRRPSARWPGFNAGFSRVFREFDRLASFW